MNDARTVAAMEPWTLRDLWRQYWRVPVIGGLAALIAFMGSFIVPATYAAGTRVLIRAKDSTVLNSTGNALGNQPGVIDSQLAGALGDTQSALLSNRAVAERVVDELGLDKMEDDNQGVIGKFRRGFASAYKWTRAMVTFGFYKAGDKRENKIAMVQEGLAAKQIDEGYAMDIVATWDDPEIAADIANTAADVLVEMTNERFARESAAYRDLLAEQTDGALVTEQEARDALAEYKAANGITTTPEQDAQLLNQSQDDLSTLIRSTQAELQAAEAEASSLRSDLAGTSPYATSSQEITTGRSQTNIDSNAPNPAYTALLSQVQEAEARVRSLNARLGALEGAFETAAGSEVSGLSVQEAELARRQLDLTIASETRARLAVELEAASFNAQRSAVEITRIDEAAAPTYPVSPKRYLYLAVGLFVGALVGFVWSFMKVQRRLRSGALAPVEEASGSGNGVAEVDLTVAEELVLSRSQRGGSATEHTETP